MKTTKGFTIVELLIVIVVIAILAVISVVAYNGIQMRARNQAKITAATQIVKMIDSYTISTGTQLPGIPVCLPTGNSDYNSDGTKDCFNVTDPVAPSNTEKSATNIALANAGITNLSYPQDIVNTTDGRKFRGIVITYNNAGYGINGILQPYFVYFILEGNAQDCASAYSIKTVGSTADPLNALGYAPYYSYGSGITLCAYTLKHVSSL